MYDTGFFTLNLDDKDNLFKGSVLAIKRFPDPVLEAFNDKTYEIEGESNVSCDGEALHLSEVKLYQTPNMLQLPEVSITPDTSPALPHETG